MKLKKILSIISLGILTIAGSAALVSASISIEKVKISPSVISCGEDATISFYLNNNRNTTNNVDIEIENSYLDIYEESSKTVNGDGRKKVTTELNIGRYVSPGVYKVRVNIDANTNEDTDYAYIEVEDCYSNNYRDEYIDLEREYYRYENYNVIDYPSDYENRNRLNYNYYDDYNYNSYYNNYDSNDYTYYEDEYANSKCRNNKKCVNTQYNTNRYSNTYYNPYSYVQNCRSYIDRYGEIRQTCGQGFTSPLIAQPKVEQMVVVYPKAVHQEIVVRYQ